jgi:hypothetical protein
MNHADTPITRDDIDRSADDARSKAIPAGIFLLVVVVVIAYLMGKRVGRTRSTVVEIRRI